MSKQGDQREHRGARIVSLNVSRGGVPKTPVERAFLDVRGLEGDAVAHPKIHGGPTRAICLYSRELLDRLRREGHDVFPGALGENVTLEGLDLATIEPGAKLALGSAVVEITKRVTPCHQIARYFVKGEFKRILHDEHPGDARLYARVLVPGELAVGDPVKVL